ncbi:MAG: hypothetical protein ACKE5M_02730 [Methylophilaceae bacterium]
MLSETKIIIQEAEDLILGKYRDDIPNFISKHMNDVSYIFAGLKRSLLPVKQFLFIFVPLITTALIFTSCFSVEKETESMLVMFSFFIPIAIVVFARPSNFCFVLITDNVINELMNTIKLNGFVQKHQLITFTKTIDLAKGRVDKRNKNFNWLFGSYLAICIFMINFYWKLATNIGEFDFQAFINSVTLPVILFILFTPFFYILINSYKKGNDAVFQLIYLSINELENTFNKQAEAKNKRKKRYQIKNNN